MLTPVTEPTRGDTVLYANRCGEMHMVMLDSQEGGEWNVKRVSDSSITFKADLSELYKCGARDTRMVLKVESRIDKAVEAKATAEKALRDATEELDKAEEAGIDMAQFFLKPST